MKPPEFTEIVFQTILAQSVDLGPPDDWPHTLITARGNKIYTFDVREFFRGEEEKSAFGYGFMPDMIRKTKADIFAFYTTAWMALGPTEGYTIDDYLAGRYVTPPSQRPDREEALTVHIAAIAYQRFYIAKIVRHTDAAPTLEPFREVAQMIAEQNNISIEEARIDLRSVGRMVDSAVKALYDVRKR